MPKKGKENFQNFINNLKIGEIVNFPLKGALFGIQGEVRDFYFCNKQFYLIIYSFLKREVFTYILTEDLYLLIPPGQASPESPDANLLPEKIIDNQEPEPVNPDLFRCIPFYQQNEMDDAAETASQHISFFSNSFVKKTLAVIIIAALVCPLFGYFIGPIYSFWNTAYSYDEFLKKDFAMTELIAAVRQRIHYRPDVFDEWDTPAAAWQKRAGDCEEMAALCAAYLIYHKATCYLIGLQTEKLNTAHAVVFSKANNQYYVLDPTMAIEPEGFKVLPAFITSLKQATQHYTPVPAIIYKIPAFNGEKKVIGILDSSNDLSE